MKKNWLIFLACAVAIAAQIGVADDKTIPPASAKPDPKVRVIGVEEFDKLRANRTNIVLDVRTPREFKAGHIPGALNIGDKPGSTNNGDSFNGTIDIKVEYLSTESVQNDPKAKVSGDPNNNETVLKGILSSKGVNVLNFCPCADENVFVVTKATSSKYHLTKVSDLAKPAP